VPVGKNVKMLWRPYVLVAPGPLLAAIGGLFTTEAAYAARSVGCCPVTLRSV